MTNAINPYVSMCFTERIEELEKKIKVLVSSQRIKLADLKTRKIGGANFAELKIKLDPRIKLDRASYLAKSF